MVQRLNFIESFPDGSIVCMAVTDSAEKNLSQDAKNYVAGLGSVNIDSLGRRHTLALLTAKGVAKPAWFIKKYARAGEGPSIIEATFWF